MDATAMATNGIKNIIHDIYVMSCAHNAFIPIATTKENMPLIKATLYNPFVTSKITCTIAKMINNINGIHGIYYITRKKSVRHP
jgi:hypothetical protein